MAKKKKEMSEEQEEKQRASNRQIMVKMREEGTDPPEIYHPWKEALKKPIEMPEQEIDLSEYEMIRRAHIKAIRVGVAAAGFFWKMDKIRYCHNSSIPK